MPPLHRLVPALGLALLLGALTLAAAYFWEARADYARHQRREAAVEARLAVARARLAEQEKILDRLRHDPAYVERVVRQRLGYVRPGEVIFRFDERGSNN